MMKRKMWKIVSLIVVFAMLMGSVTVWAEGNGSVRTARHYNVGLVIDGSGSLHNENGTDVDGNRYEAIKLFLSVLTNKGNRVGAIVFSDKLVLDTGMKELKNMAEKEALAEEIRNAHVGGDTDIGGALERALAELVGEGADESLPSCILLFSDGETEMNDPAAHEESLQKKETSIEQAKSLGIPIHGICLNANQSANTQEVKSIAEQTGGVYLEIKDASDLDAAFLQFYTMIYGEEGNNGDEIVIPPEGFVEETFKIPSVGVAEVNILIEAEQDPEKITLTRPDGTTYSDTELKAAMLSTSKYDVIKVEAPEMGVWKVKVDGAPGTKLRFNWIYNTDLTAEIECPQAEGDLQLNSEVSIYGYLLSDDKKIESEEVYGEYSGTLILTNAATGEESVYPMETDGTRFKTDITLTEFGTYNAVLQLTCGNIQHTSNTTVLDVGNKAPKAKKADVKKTIMTLPFGGAKATFDMKEFFSDPEGQELTYELKNESYSSDKVKLEGGKLVIDAKGVKEGKVSVVATDTQGASASILFTIKTFNVGILILIVLILIAAVVVAVIVMKKNKEANMVSNWTITVESFDRISGMSSQPFMQTGIRGVKNDIRKWNIVECGIQGNFVVVPVKGQKFGGVKFVSKQPFETEDGRKVTEYKFMIGDDAHFYAAAASEDERMERGVRIIISD